MIVPHLIPYLAHTFGSVPVASRIKIGMFGLFFFIVGYARLRNVLNGLQILNQPLATIQRAILWQLHNARIVYLPRSFTGRRRMT